VVIDDVITTGESKFEALRQLEAAGLVVRDVVVLVNRGPAAAGTLAKAGYRLHAVADLPHLVEAWHAAGVLDGEAYAATLAYLAQTQAQ
jgi:uridine monophosphate synthetase